MHKYMSPFTQTNEWINVQMHLHICTHTIQIQSLSPFWKRRQWRSHSTTVLWRMSSFSASEHHLWESCFAFLREELPELSLVSDWTFFCFFSLLRLLPLSSLSNILAAGFEMPLQLQIDSSGFLRFFYLSFSIRLKGESGNLCSPPGHWKIEIALVEQIICVTCCLMKSFCLLNKQKKHSR